MAYISFQPKDYFATKLYSGTGSSNAITGLGFSPTWVWIKSRSAGEGHGLFDQLRGVNVRLQSHSSSAQSTQTDSLASFDSDGFTVGGSSNNDAVNGSGQNFVSWNWKANGAGSSNTDGSITSTVSANTTSGFSIVKYTGTGANATVGTGLGQIPSVVLVKSRSNGEHWCMYHSSLGNASRLLLNLTNAVETSRTEWQSTTPTSSVFSVDGSDQVNGSGSKTYVAYCFAEKTGFSKFGSYRGNGNADGAFVYTGFKPAFVMIKNSSVTESWYILDTKRPGYNTNNYYLKPNVADAEGTSATLAMSLLSNGFKINNSDTSMNTSGKTYIYMAFAEAPLVSSNGVPATAR